VSACRPTVFIASSIKEVYSGICKNSIEARLIGSPMLSLSWEKPRRSGGTRVAAAQGRAFLPRTMPSWHGAVGFRSSPKSGRFLSLRLRVQTGSLPRLSHQRRTGITQARMHSNGLVLRFVEVAPASHMGNPAGAET
jgi:hypothetical protein